MRRKLIFRDTQTGRFITVFEACRLPEPRVHTSHIRVMPRRRRHGTWFRGNNL